MMLSRATIHWGQWKLATAVLAALTILFTFAPAVHAQAVAVAEVSGHVTDPSGQSIVGATIRMTETDRNQVRTTTSDATGRYVMSNLPVGAYRLEVTSPGFKGYIQNGITLQVATNIEIPVTLQIGAVTESVTVTSNAAMVETKENSISQVIDHQRIEELPLNDRNPARLLTLSGGTSTMTLNGGDLTGSKNMQGSNGSVQFSVAGAQANGVNFLLDGGDNNDAFSN